MQNDHINGIMMGHKKKIVFFFISKKGPNSNILHIWKVYRIFYLSSNFDAVFSSNLLGQELSAACQRISFIFYDFRNEFNRKETTKAKF